MAKRFDFETLHPNHKFAFLDGLLTGGLMTIMISFWVKEYLEERKLTAAYKASKADDPFIIKPSNLK